MEAKLRVNPTFTFEFDLTAIIKVERALSFYRNSHGLERDTELDQLLALFKNTLSKVREYDAALRGLTLSTSSSKIEPDVEEADATPMQKAEAAFPPKPASASPPGASPGIPPGTEGVPPWFEAKPTVQDLAEKVKPKPSKAPPPPSSTPTITADEAVRRTLPKDSGVAPPPPSTTPALPPGGFPNFGPPLPTPGTAPPVPGVTPGPASAPPPPTQQFKPPVLPPGNPVASPTGFKAPPPPTMPKF